MWKHTILYVIIGVLVGFWGGFLLTNTLNRQEFDRLRGELNSLKAGQTGTTQTNQSASKLSEDEIKNLIQQADGKADDAAFQKNVGFSLYRYASMQQQYELLPEVARLLKRAYQANPKDYDLVVGLGNVLFDIGQTKKEQNSFVEARDYYQKALQIKADDIDVRTDLGLTYFLSSPSEPDKAIAEYQKSLKLQPKHEKTLHFLTQALIASKQFDEAEKRLAELKGINPTYQFLPDLQTQLEQAKVSQSKGWNI